jgi:hypothetical protein
MRRGSPGKGYVACQTCQAEGPMADFGPPAVIAWDRRAATPGPGAIERAAEQDKATIDRLAKALRRTLGELMARCGELPEPIATLVADRAVARILAAELGAGGDAADG